jgi:hypothetical protein
MKHKKITVPAEVQQEIEWIKGKVCASFTFSFQGAEILDCQNIDIGTRVAVATGMAAE